MHPPKTHTHACGSYRRDVIWLARASESVSAIFIFFARGYRKKGFHINMCYARTRISKFVQCVPWQNYKPHVCARCGNKFASAGFAYFDALLFPCAGCARVSSSSSYRACVHKFIYCGIK